MINKRAIFKVALILGILNGLIVVVLLAADKDPMWVVLVMFFELVAFPFIIEFTKKEKPSSPLLEPLRAAHERLWNEFDATRAKGEDSDYSHAYQDEYQRLWHETAKNLQASESREEFLTEQLNRQTENAALFYGTLELVRDHIKAGHANDWALDAIRDALAGRDPRPQEKP